MSIADGELLPAWLGDRDRPWLRDLLEVAAGYVGRRVEEWLHRSRETELDPRAGARQRVALHVLDSLLRRAAVGPRRSSTRLQLYRAAAGGSIVRRDESRKDLFDDLPMRRTIRWPDPDPDPVRLALLANTVVAQSLLRRATEVHLQLVGASRAVLQTSWLHGVPWRLQPEPGQLPATTRPVDLHLEARWREPALRERARRIDSIVPLLPWARRYRLRAPCDLGPIQGSFVLTTGDPLLPSPEPRRYDSNLERRFVRDLRHLAPHCRVVREPQPIETSRGLAFPDFALTVPGRVPWLCEIAGLRIASALPAKLALLEHPRLVLCLPEASVPEGLRGHGRVVPFRRWVEVGVVLRVVGV